MKNYKQKHIATYLVYIYIYIYILIETMCADCASYNACTGFKKPFCLSP